MKRRFLVVALTAVVLLATLTPAAAQDAVKAEIRQAIDAAYLNAYWNGMDVKAILAGWDHGAISPRFVNNNDLAYVTVAEEIAGAVRESRKPPEKKEFTFLYPVIDVTGGMAMAKVEVMRGQTLAFTYYFPVVKARAGWKIVGYPYYQHRNGARPETAAGEADAVKKVVEDTLVRGLLQDGTKEQVMAGMGPFCDINLYLPEVDLVTKQDLTPVFATKAYVKSRADRGDPRPPIKTSAFTLIGLTGDVAAGKLAVTFDRGTVMTMYVVLYKLKTGWAIVQIATDKHVWMSLFLPQ
jgi:hypothetical protein